MRIALCAGEASGDQLGADLAASLKSLQPDLDLAGVTGPAMATAGVDRWQDVDALSVMGLSEILAHLPRLFRLRRDLRRRTLDWNPAAFVGIDAPDFNLGLARQLRKQGLFTCQFVSPSVWAWRAYRINKIARSLDLMLTLFPFEPELYRQAGLDARFVGHPMADAIPMDVPAEPARRKLGLPASGTVVTLLPGSRGGELRRHARIIAGTADTLVKTLPGITPVIALAADRHRGLLLEAAPELAGTRIVCGDTRTAIAAADTVVAASGTVTLECLLLKRPTVAFYRLAPATYTTARLLRLVRSRWIALPNILAQRALIPEFIQADATGRALAEATIGWLDDAPARRRFAETARTLHEQLARNAGATAARILLERLDGRG